MTRVDWNGYTCAMHTGLTEASNLGYSTAVNPFTVKSPWVPVDARRPAPLEDFIVTRDEMDTKPATLLDSLAPGSVRQLIAGTGVGKTTMMPMRLVQATSGVGIVLFHDSLLPLITKNYVSAVAADHGFTFKPTLLSSRHLAMPVSGPVLYYASAVNFLARLSAYPDLVSLLNLDFIYLDESHVANPEYYVFRLLVTAGKLGKAKVFYGTATGPADISLETGGFKRTSIEKPEDLFPSVPTLMLSVNSPLYYKNIVSRTVVFLANDDECIAWRDYYESYDVPGYIFGYRTSSTRYMDMEQFVMDNPVGVVLTTSRLETGYTVPWDKVIDCGYTAKVVVDTDTQKVRISRVPVTQQVRTQRIGRVGRMKAGNAEVARVKFSPVLDEHDDTIGFYIYLWALVLCITIRNPAISRFKDTGIDDRGSAAVLLHCRIPPLLMMSYVGNGGFYSGFEQGGSRLFVKGVRFDNDGTDCPNVGRWPQYVLPPSDFLFEPVKYKAPAVVPDGWTYALAYVYMHYAQSDLRHQVDADTKSVISIAETERRSSRISVKRSSSIVGSALPRICTQIDGKDIIPEFQVFNGPRSSYAPTVQSMRIPAGNTVVMPVAADVSPTIKSVTEWDDGHSYRKVRSNRRRSSRSSSGSDPATVTVKQVDPVKYKRYKLYPIHDEYKMRLLNCETPNHKDARRVYDLVTAKVLITKLGRDSSDRKDKLADYFLSVIRVHNAAVGTVIQMEVVNSPTFFDKIKGRASMREFETKIDDTVGLLKAFIIEGYFVGIDRRSVHSGFSDYVQADLDQYAQVGACYVASAGSVLKVAVSALLVNASPIVDESGRVVACAWKAFDKLVTVHHVLDNVEADVSELRTDALVYANADVDIAIFHQSQVSLGFFPVAPIVAGNDVIICAHEVFTKKFQVLGMFTVSVIGDVWCVDTVLDFGYSGSVVYDVVQQRVVALYVGLFTTDEFGNDKGRVAPLYDAWVNVI